MPVVPLPVFWQILRQHITPMPTIARELAKAGIASIRFNFGGHWCSEDYKRIYGDNAELIVVENENHRISRKTKQVAVLVAEFFMGCF